jgi:hypothetical protein
MLAALYARATRGAGRRRDDAGSMPLALLVTLVSVTLGASISGLVVGQIRDAQRAEYRTSAVASAQAGLDAALATIQASMSSTGGVLSKLPCATLTGSLPGNGPAGAAYSSSVGYFRVDPTPLVNTLKPIGDLTNLSKLTAGTTVTALLTSLQQPIPGGTGVSDIAGAASGAIGCVNNVVSAVPSFALLRATGTVGGTGRTLYATYTFQSSGENTSGGKVSIFDPRNGLCFGDAAATPAAGDLLSAVLCATAAKQVSFVYAKNLNLVLAQTRTSANPKGLCITAPTLSDGAAVTFRNCADPSEVDQQWDYDPDAATYWAGTNTTPPQRSTWCLDMKTPSAFPGGAIVIRGGANCGRGGVLGKSFTPDETVGSGGAGPNTGQFVNKDEVGRCLDLTDQDPSGATTQSYNSPVALITYPCKQAFDGVVFWNHKWAQPALSTADIQAGRYSASGTISTTPDSGSYKGKTYCMRSPGGGGGFVWVSQCSTTDTSTPLHWTVWFDAPTMAQSYQITDGFGNCLEAAGSLGPAYLSHAQWSTVITTRCDGSDIQKWNAPASFKAGPLSGVQEQ